MQWLRLYHDTITDEKWRVVANESGQPVGNVLAVWMSMLINASNSSERGTLEGWQDRYVAANLGYPTDAVRAIREAMQGVVLNGDRLSGWDNRQRQGSDDAAERQRRSRANKQPKTPPNGAGGRHGANGMSRDKEPTSRDSHVTVTENPLTLTSFPTDTLNKDDDDDAGARLVAHRVAELANLDAKKIRVGMVEAWLAAGCDPEKDIYPAVRHCVDRAPGPIGSGNYFDEEVRRHHIARISPPSNISYLPRAAGGRHAPSDAMSAGAQDLMAALTDPNFTYRVGR